MLLDWHAFFLRFLELIEHALGFVDFFRLTFEFHPAFAGRDFYTERILHGFQELEIVRVKRLQLARVIEMQSSSFAHQRSTTSKIDKSEPDWHIHQRKP